MLTRQGWLVGLGGVALIGLGRLVGAFELFVLGAAALALLVAASISVAVIKLRIEVRRDVHPHRVHAGTPSRVELLLRNVGSRRTPVLNLVDPVSGTRGAELLVGPLEPLGTARAAYRLPTDRRGILQIGPLRVAISDPFGLSAIDTVAAAASELTVYPRVDQICALPQAAGHDPHAGAEHPNMLGRSGEDFYALRPYTVGDDLRRVHWPSTARHDELMVRQDELPWQGRATILLDLRRNTHSAASIELAVSAAASIAEASWRRRDLVRLLSTDGTDSGFAAGTPHIEAIMEHLATVGPTNRGSLQGTLDALTRAPGGGALVVVVADITEQEFTSISRTRTRFGLLTIVQFEQSSWDPSVRPTPGVPTPQLLRITSDLSFATAWNRAMERKGRTAWTAPESARLSELDPR